MEDTSYQQESYFYWNKHDENEFYLDEVENAIDSLETAVTFLSRTDNLKWKWIAFAMHHSLYSFSIACLVNGNYENVLSSGKDDDKNRYCLMGNNTKWKKSKRVYQNNGPGYVIEWEDTDEIPSQAPPEEIEEMEKKKHKRQLIGFWTALARVQDSYYWMGRSFITRAVKLSAEEWKSIEWLTNNVRNDLVHFVPKLLSVSIGSVKKACLDLLRVLEFLALHSGALLYHCSDWRERIERAVVSFRNGVGA